MDQKATWVAIEPQERLRVNTVSVMLPAFILYFPHWMINPTSTIAICLHSFLGSSLQLHIRLHRRKNKVFTPSSQLTCELYHCFILFLKYLLICHKYTLSNEQTTSFMAKAAFFMVVRATHR